MSSHRCNHGDEHERQNTNCVEFSQPLDDPIPKWQCRVRKALEIIDLRAYGLRNVLFLHPRELEANKSVWREVEPLPDADASRDEPPF